MQLNWIDFFIGYFLISFGFNSPSLGTQTLHDPCLIPRCLRRGCSLSAMPHLLVAQTEVRFLSLFGYGSKANYGYAAFNLTISLILFQVRYGLNNLFNHGLFLGALFILLAYIRTGRFFYNRFKAK